MSDSVVQALQRAIQLAGGQTELANRVNVQLRGRPQWAEIKPIKQAHIWSWLKRTKRIPGEYGTPIELAVKGEVKRYHLCPAVFDAPSAQVPAKAGGLRCADA